MAIQKNLNEPITIKPNKVGEGLWYASFILIVPAIIHVVNMNNFKRMETKINEADSGIDVQLAKRRDLLIKMVDATKQAMAFEKSVLTEVTKLREQNISALNMDEKSKFNAEMDQMLRNINVQMEAYPELKSSANILKLQEAISDVEDDIAAARRIYNANVSMYNQNIQVYPKNVAAKGKTTKMFFEASDIEKADVDINLM